MEGTQQRCMAMARVSLKEVLRAGVACSASSLGAPGVGSRIETSDAVSEGCRKRKGKAVAGAGEGKKVKVESAWRLVGRLLLWNRAASSHPGAGSNSLDCLAFCDGSDAVCCTVQSLDVGLLGQLVQVNAWTFVPASKHSDKLGHADVRGLNGTERTQNAKSQGVSGNEPQYSDCGGCLEIHSLKLLDERFVPTAQVPDFPSLCLSPAAANARNVVLESPLEKIGTSKPRLKVRGWLHSISPPFLIPSKASLQYAPEAADGRILPGQGPQKTLFKDKSGSRVQSDSQSMLGFLVELRSCCHGSRCQPKYKENSPGTSSSCQSPEEGVVDVGEDGTAAIYFSGAVASWRPLLGEMLGDCIAISGLRRKMIRPGHEMKEFCIYVATRTSLVLRRGPPVVDAHSKVEEAVGFCKHVIGNGLQNQPRDQSRHIRDLDGLHDASSSKELRFQMHSRTVPNGKALEKSGQGLRSYVGKITSILMENQLLELDDKVWLLLTHYKHTQVHGLRVGALVAVRHAHIMTLKTISEKVLVLGACVRSHVWVVLHSVWNTGSRISQASQSRLNKYIGSLPFAWAFWVIHVITSLGCKFKGVYSDKELLGSMKHAGLIRKALPSIMGTPATLHRDAFKEFLLHEQFCLLGDNSASALLTKVPPLSNFCNHVEMLWVDPISSIWHEGHIKTDNWEPGTRFCKPLISQTSCYVRNIIPGAKLGIVLLGSLKVCESTGKLQLVDATGAFDVVVPDLRSLANLHSVYQIAKYKLVMEGEYKAPDVSAAGKSNNVPSSLSWSSLLKGSILENRIPLSLSYYVKFYLRFAKRLEGLTWHSQLQSHESEAVMSFLSTSDVKNDPADVWKGKEFNIALITHKYPARLKYSPDKEKQWAFDVEVVLLPYNLLIHQDNDVCSTTLIPPLQNLDFSSRKVQGAIESPVVVATHQRHKLEQLGGINTHAYGSTFANSRCLIDCSVCCLVEQRSGVKKFSVQPCCTLSASLVAGGCSIRAPISGSYCATKEEHWARLSESELQKIVLAFNWRSIEISQVFNTGDWCLLPTLQDNVLPFNSSELSSAVKRVEVDAKRPLISLQWKYAVDIQVSQVDTKTFEQVASSSRGTNSTYISDNLPESSRELAECATESDEDIRKINLRRCSTGDSEAMSERTLSSKPQLVDVVLTLSNALGDEFRNWLSFLKRKLIPPTLSVSEVLRLTTRPATLSSKSGSNLGEIFDMFSAVKLEASSGIFSLQGEVVSVQGKLEAAECSNDSISTGDDGLNEPMCPRFSACSQRQTTLFQLRDLYTNQLIRIQINFDKYVRPFGFGPGAVACFRRILLRRNANLLVGIPTTDVLIESVEKRLYILPRKIQPLSSDSFPPQDQEDCAGNVNVVDLLNDFICELEPRKKCLKVHCRVVSVQELELEWQISRPLSQRNFSADTVSVRDDMVWDIAVKWGCFIIDDGSAVAECWAKGDRAAKFLGLHGLAGDVSTICPSMIALAQLSSHPSENQAGIGGSLPQVLRSVVRRHKRVWVQGEPPQGDAGSTSWLMKGVDGDLEESEAMILRFVLEQACQRGPKVVHCTTVSEEDNISEYAEAHHRGQTLSSAATMGNSKPWQNLTWNRTQLFATKVEVLNTWAGLQQLASSFDL